MRPYNQVAIEGSKMQNCCIGPSNVVLRMFRHRHGRHDRCKVYSKAVNTTHEFLIVKLY